MPAFPPPTRTSIISSTTSRELSQGSRIKTNSGFFTGADWQLGHIVIVPAGISSLGSQTSQLVLALLHQLVQDGEAARSDLGATARLVFVKDHIEHLAQQGVRIKKSLLRKQLP